MHALYGLKLQGFHIDNEAFLLKNQELRERFTERYKKTAKLYYNGQPDFNELLAEIGKWVEKL